MFSFEFLLLVSNLRKTRVPLTHIIIKAQKLPIIIRNAKIFIKITASSSHYNAVIFISLLHVTIIYGVKLSINSVSLVPPNISGVLVLNTRFIEKKKINESPSCTSTIHMKSHTVFILKRSTTGTHKCYNRSWGNNLHNSRSPGHKRDNQDGSKKKKKSHYVANK